MRVPANCLLQLEKKIGRRARKEERTHNSVSWKARNLFGGDEVIENLRQASFVRNPYLSKE